MKHWIIGGALLAGAVLGAASAEAQYYEEPDIRVYGYRDHTGFFSHLSLGVGYSATTGDTPGPELTWGGVSSAYHFALGGSVMPGFAVHFSAFGFDSFGGNVEVDGDELEDVDANTSLNTLGAGVTYYVPNLNLYLSGAAGLALVTVTDATGDGFGLDPGFAVRGAVGYEWWIGSSWGLGMAVQASYFRATEDSSAGDSDWSGYAIAPMFSATNN